MDDEQSARLSQDMFDAKDDAGRIRVAIHWLPVLIRCLMKTAGRVKLMLARLEALEQKVDALHAKDGRSEAAAEDESAAVERHVPPILVWLGKNWTWLFIMILCLKNNGLVEIFQWIIGVER